MENVTITASIPSLRQGKQGIQGLPGEKGDKGDTGDQGEKGIQGIQGERGEQGLRGEKGEQGIQGLKGDTGAKGEKGADGGLNLDDGIPESAIKKNGTVIEPYLSYKSKTDENGWKIPFDWDRISRDDKAKWTKEYLKNFQYITWTDPSDDWGNEGKQDKDKVFPKARRIASIDKIEIENGKPVVYIAPWGVFGYPTFAYIFGSGASFDAMGANPALHTDIPSVNDIAHMAELAPIYALIEKLETRIKKLES